MNFSEIEDMKSKNKCTFHNSGNTYIKFKINRSLKTGKNKNNENVYILKVLLDNSVLKEFKTEIENLKKYEKKFVSDYSHGMVNIQDIILDYDFSLIYKYWYIRKIKTADIIEELTGGKLISEGGSGSAFIIRNKKTKKEEVLKVLTNYNLQKNILSSKEKRFINEINTLRRCKILGIEGVINIIHDFKELDIHKNEDYNFNISDIKEYQWYIMEKGNEYQPKDNKNSHGNIIKVINDFIYLTNTLIILHKNGICHRDIKFSNLVQVNGLLKLIDFGIAQDRQSEYKDITLYNDATNLGSKFTIAPEMRRDPVNADGKKADVYSLMKTFWGVVNKNHQCFEGKYNPIDKNNEGSRLRLNVNFKISEFNVHQLLKDSTEHDPELRPSLECVKKVFEEIVKHEMNPLIDEIKIDKIWKIAIKNLINIVYPNTYEYKMNLIDVSKEYEGLEIPAYCKWNNTNYIGVVLYEIIRNVINTNCYISYLSKNNEKFYSQLCYGVLSDNSGSHMKYIIPFKHILLREDEYFIDSILYENNELSHKFLITIKNDNEEYSEVIIESHPTIIEI